MSVIEEIKPRSKGEWSLLLIAVFIVIATIALIFYRLLLPQEDDRMLLEAITQASTTHAETSASEVSSTAPGTALGAAPQKARMLALTGNLATLWKDFSEQQFSPLREGLAKASEAQIRKAEDLTPEEIQMVTPEGLGVAEAPVQQPVQQPVETVPPVQPQTPTGTFADGTPLPTRGSDAPSENGYSGPLPTRSDAAGQAAGSTTVPAAPGSAGQPQTPATGTSAGTTGGTATGTPSTMVPDASTIAAIQGAILDLINQSRVAAGLNALVYDPTEQAAASQRAYDLSQFYSSAHSRPDGTYSLSWIQAAYGPAYGAAENIGWFDGAMSMNASSIFNSFWNSGKGHKEVMMLPYITRGAIGIYAVPGNVPANGTGMENANGTGRFFVSMNFGK